MALENPHSRRDLLESQTCKIVQRCTVLGENITDVAKGTGHISAAFWRVTLEYGPPVTRWQNYCKREEAWESLTREI
jgi:hypothetical protein